jgi:glycine/D-amino acid oxidase-like deaminating enzyme
MNLEFENRPYWWGALKPYSGEQPPLPTASEIVVIGGGITGLNAAMTLAQAGRDVLVLEKQRPGYGASSRNAGYLSKAHLHSLSTLIRKHGEERALPLVEEACKAYDYAEALIEREPIDCQYQRCGRIYWAYTDKQVKYLEGEHAALKKHLRRLQIPSELVGESAKSGVLGSSQYCAGLSVPASSTLHPGLFVQGLEERVIANGGRIAAGTTLLAIARNGNEFSLKTDRGVIGSKRVIVATNAYAGSETPYFRRRMVRLLGQMIAVKPRHPDLLDQILPNHIAHLDVRAMFRYWRRSPDDTHVLFGSRTGVSARHPAKAAAHLKRSLVDIFPELADARISNYWNGLVGVTMDRFPHLGCRRGIHYAMGMNGHGVPMGTYLGHKIALQLMGDGEGSTGLDDLAFRAAPSIKGTAWFQPIIGGAQVLAEKMERRPH